MSSGHIDALEEMQKRETIDYNKIYNIIDILKGSGKLDEVTATLFDLLLKENFKCHAKINALSKRNNNSCINCHNSEFTQYVVTLRMGTGGFGMKTGENVGDLIVDICTKCKFCTFRKAPYWT